MCRITVVCVGEAGCAGSQWCVDVQALGCGKPVLLSFLSGSYNFGSWVSRCRLYTEAKQVCSGGEFQVSGKTGLSG